MGFRTNVTAILRRLVRTKSLDLYGEKGPDGEDMPGRLPKCLTTLDLVSLGVGSCMGTGMYVVSGLVAREMAGPGVILSFTIAAIASILSGVCYGEFGVRVPKTTGSAYMYSYVTVGEFTAFIIGWNLILEYLIGTAAGASALSSCFDSLFRNKISTFMRDNVGEFGIHKKTYPDLVALVIAVIMTLIVAAGVKKSVVFNNALNALNVAVWVFIIVAGFFFIDGNNWTDRGFLPFGFSGVMTGAATCFYAFIGFDIIATTGEESRNPSRSIPLAIMLSLLICLVGYVSVSFVLTLGVPFYDISSESPLMDMFVQNNAEPGKYVVAIGSIAGLTVSLLGSLFPMPRVIYAMATDGLLFRFLGHVNVVTNTPAIATIIAGFLAAIMALLLSLGDLIEMMSIGTLLAYTLVSMCVLILRYQPHVELQVSINTGLAYDTLDNEDDEEMTAPVDVKESTLDLDDRAAAIPAGRSTLQEAGPEHLLPKVDSQGTPIHSSVPKYGAVGEEEDVFRSYNRWNFYLSRAKHTAFAYSELLRIRLGLPEATSMPTPATGRSVTVTTLFLFCVLILLCTMFIHVRRFLHAWWAIIFIIILSVLVVGCIVNIIRLPQNPEKLKFMAPAVPFLPMLAIFVNVYLMLKLSYLTWIRFGIWLIAGLIIYFGYGMWNSNIEARFHDTTRKSKDGKEAILMDTKEVNMPTHPIVIPAHSSEKPQLGDSIPPPSSSSDEFETP
ncbi:solute carrier family 7 member 14-like [Diadema setosum]|uniref:solute carrier family 7 member 14-like n=1 Tax=Diadema setosum TaxID=31175 RepID=UPI003B3B6059